MRPSSAATAEVATENDAQFVLDFLSSPTAIPTLEKLLLKQTRYSNATHELQNFVLDENCPNVVHIGRHSTNNLVLYHRAGPIIVSKFHAVIEREGTDFFIQDVGARNGTYVNGKKLVPHTKVKLNVDDKILFAAAEYLPSGEYNPFQFKIVTVASRAITPPTDTVKLSSDQYGAVEEDLKCGICFEALLNPFSLVCGHTTCGDCLANWFATLPVVKSCPTCRCAVTSSSPVPCKALTDIIERIVEPRLSPEELSLRRDRMEIWNNRKDIINKKRPRPRPRTAEQIQQQVAAPAQEVHPMINIVEVVEIDDEEEDEGRNVRAREGEEEEGAVQYVIPVI